MSILQDFIAKISFGLGYSEDNEKINKITPNMELENVDFEDSDFEDSDFEDSYFEDAELGNVRIPSIEIYKNESYTINCEFKSIIQNPDLELGFGPIVEISSYGIIVDMTAFEKCRVYENYKSFIDSIIYLATPFKDRSLVFFRDVYPSWNRLLVNNEYHVIMHIESESMGLKLNKPLV